AFIGRRDSHGSVRPNWLRVISSENRLPLFGIMRSRSARHRGLAARKVVTAEPSIKSRILERAMGFEPTTPTLARYGDCPLTHCDISYFISSFVDCPRIAQSYFNFAITRVRCAALTVA